MSDPSFEDMRPNQRKRIRRANRAEQNWEPDVPRCQNCVNWSGRARARAS